MSDHAEKKAPAGAAGDKKAPEGGAEHAGGGLLAKTPVLLGGIMLIEAVVLFVGFKFVVGSGPKNANAADFTSLKTDEKPTDPAAIKQAESEAKKKLVEVPLVEFKAPNKVNGHAFIYDVSMFITIKAEQQEKTSDTIKQRDALIKDRVRTIIAESDPEKLGGGSEPGLETLRRQVKFKLDEILGEGVVDEVLVPRCIPYRTDD